LQRSSEDGQSFVSGLFEENEERSRILQLLNSCNS
jgi:hypothetical protein